MDWAPLVILAVVLVGAVVVARYLAKLKRAAVQALEEVRKMEAQVQSLQAKTAAARGAAAEPLQQPAQQRAQQPAQEPAEHGDGDGKPPATS